MKRIALLSLVSILTLFVLAIGLCLPMPIAHADGDTLPSGVATDTLATTLDDFLQQHSNNHAAVATAVFDATDVLYMRHFGTIDANATIPLDDQCVLEWGSTTKLLVWLSAMQLVQRGMLDLSADIRTYLPQDFLHNLHYDQPITMLNLMNHNAGFQETDFVLEVESTADIVDLGTYLATYQPIQVFCPGTVVAYSNWGAGLAGYIVERIAGVSFAQYVQQNIFAPLGMAHSALAADLSDNAWVQQRRQAFVSYLPDGQLSTEENKVYILPYPAGMCVSTLGDFVLFAQALLRRDDKLLSAQSFEALYSPSLYYTNSDRGRIAHGFLIDYDFAVPIVGHDGNTLGGSSRLLLDLQDGLGMVMLTNQLGGSVYRNAMAQLVFGDGQNHIAVDGTYIPARNILRGKQMYLSNFMVINYYHITSQMADGLYFNLTPDRMEISTCDYLVPTTNYAARDAAAIIWLVLLGYALVNMLVRIVSAIVDGVKHRPLNMPSLMSALYSLLLVLSAVVLEPAISAVTAFVYMLVLIIGGVALAFYQVRTTRTQCATTLGKVGYGQTWSLLLCLALTVLNLFLWDLVAFWL